MLPYIIEKVLFGVSRWFLFDAPPSPPPKENGLAELLASDDYFNNLEYDVMVKCMAHVLLVWRLLSYS